MVTIGNAYISQSFYKLDFRFGPKIIALLLVTSAVCDMKQIIRNDWTISRELV